MKDILSFSHMLFKEKISILNLTLRECLQCFLLGYLNKLTRYERFSHCSSMPEMGQNNTCLLQRLDLPMNEVC